MKKTWIFASVLTLTVVFFATVNAMATSATNVSLKKTPDHIHGPIATVLATDDGQHGNGNGHRQGDGNGQGNNNYQHGNGKNKSQSKMSNYTGSISAVDASSLTLTMGDGSTVAFILNANTQIKIPTLHGSATFSDLTVGEHVTVRAYKDVNQSLVASMILLIPGKPEKIHRVGTVTAFQPGVSITIQDKDGNLFTFQLTSQTKILPPDLAGQLAVGVRVTIIAPRDVARGTLTADGIVVHPAGSGGTRTPANTPTTTETPTATATATETATSTETATP